MLSTLQCTEDSFSPGAGGAAPGGGAETGLCAANRDEIEHSGYYKGMYRQKLRMKRARFVMSTRQVPAEILARLNNSVSTSTCRPVYPRAESRSKHDDVTEASDEEELCMAIREAYVNTKLARHWRQGCPWAYTDWNGAELDSGTSELHISRCMMGKIV